MSRSGADADNLRRLVELVKRLAEYEDLLFKLLTLGLPPRGGSAGDVLRPPELPVAEVPVRCEQGPHRLPGDGQLLLRCGLRSTGAGQTSPTSSTAPGTSRATSARRCSESPAVLGLGWGETFEQSTCGSSSGCSPKGLGKVGRCQTQASSPRPSRRSSASRALSGR